jgi:hypothetical protein
MDPRYQTSSIQSRPSTTTNQSRTLLPAPNALPTTLQQQQQQPSTQQQQQSSSAQSQSSSSNNESNQISNVDQEKVNFVLIY